MHQLVPALLAKDVEGGIWGSKAAGTGARNGLLVMCDQKQV